MVDPQPRLVPPTAAVPDPPSSLPLKIVYWLCLLGGLAGGIYVFLVARFSESELVELTPVVTYPFVFGAYGLLAERGLRKVRRGEVSNLGIAFLAMMKLAGLLGVLVLGILLLPLLLLGKLKSSLVIALIGAAFWAGLLWFFFVAVFPSL
jgi:hypothetical protein